MDSKCNKLKLMHFINKNFIYSFSFNKKKILELSALNNLIYFQ